MAPSRVTWLPLALLVLAGVHAYTDVPGQLRLLSDVVVPPKPPTFPPHLTKNLNGLEWDKLSAPLQHAVLWDAGLVRADRNKSTPASVPTYVQVYVPCGRTMNDVFLARALVGRDEDDSIRCDLETCNAATVNFVKTTCNLYALYNSTVCGLDATLLDQLSESSGASWSQDGQIDSSYDPVVTHQIGAGRDLSASRPSLVTVNMFSIREKASLRLEDGDCPAKASFIVPCRKLAATEYKTPGQRQWCEPQLQLGVQLWIQQVIAANSSSSGSPSANNSASSSSGSSSTITILLGVALCGAIVLCIVLLVMLRKSKSSDRRPVSRDFEEMAGTPGYTVAAIGHQDGGSSDGYGYNNGNGNGSSNGHLKRVSEVGGRVSDATTVVTGLSSSTVREIERANQNYRKRSPQLALFCEDQALMMKRIAFVRLTFLEPIATGANGDVWRGQYEGQIVAIKRTRQPAKRDGDDEQDDVDLRALEEFAKEIRLASVLDHPNVVRFIGLSWRMLPDLSMISEYMPMGDLARLLESSEGKQMTWGDEKVSLAVDIANALVYLHSLTPLVVHRDLKSRNVLLDEQLYAKISDFGLSRERDPDETMTSGIGTLLWTAPEVLRGERYDEKADLYSFGVLLVELDTCLPPYSLNHEVAGVRSKGMQLVPLISSGKIQPTFSPQCPTPIQELARQCLDQDPANRPPAMQVVYHLRSKIRPLL